MSSEQQALGKIILKDPAVESLSSFIGIDGTNTTLNSGRILINLKPLDERKISASDVIRRLQPELAGCRESPCLCSRCRISRGRPGQPHAVPVHPGRSQRRTSWIPSRPDGGETAGAPELRDVASDQQVGGLRAEVVFDRNTAYRLGITPSTIDQTLYDAYGQREVSTIFTQLNQYHVVLEVKPDFQNNPLDLRDLFIRTNAASGTRFHGLGVWRVGGHAVVRAHQLIDGGYHQPFEFHVLRPSDRNRLRQRLRRRADCFHIAVPQWRPGAAGGFHAR